jgi:hypothetical protein
MLVVPFVIGTRIAPVVATVVVIATLIACVCVAKANDKYLGGLAWPYFSDTGTGAAVCVLLRVGLPGRPF